MSTRFNSAFANFLGVVDNSFDEDDTMGELNHHLLERDDRPTAGLPITIANAGARSVPSTPMTMSPTSLFAPYFAQYTAGASTSPAGSPVNESPSTNAKAGASNVGTITSYSHLRRASESVHDTSAQDHYASRKPLARRYTLPSIVGGVVNVAGAGKDGTASRAPIAPFWEASGREDSAVQATMANVFGF